MNKDVLFNQNPSSKEPLLKLLPPGNYYRIKNDELIVLNEAHKNKDENFNKLLSGLLDKYSDNLVTVKYRYYDYDEREIATLETNVLYFSSVIEGNYITRMTLDLTDGESAKVLNIVKSRADKNHFTKDFECEITYKDDHPKENKILDEIIALAKNKFNFNEGDTYIKTAIKNITVLYKWDGEINRWMGRFINGYYKVFNLKALGIELDGEEVNIPLINNVAVETSPNYHTKFYNGMPEGDYHEVDLKTFNEVSVQLTELFKLRKTENTLIDESIYFDKISKLVDKILANKDTNTFHVRYNVLNNPHYSNHTRHFLISKDDESHPIRYDITCYCIKDKNVDYTSIYLREEYLTTIAQVNDQTVTIEIDFYDLPNYVGGTLGTLFNHVSNVYNLDRSLRVADELYEFNLNATIIVHPLSDQSIFQIDNLSYLDMSKDGCHPVYYIDKLMHKQ